MHKLEIRERQDLTLNLILESTYLDNINNFKNLPRLFLDYAFLLLLFYTLFLVLERFDTHWWPLVQRWLTGLKQVPFVCASLLTPEEMVDIIEIWILFVFGDLVIEGPIMRRGLNKESSLWCYPLFWCNAVYFRFLSGTFARRQEKSNSFFDDVLVRFDLIVVPKRLFSFLT